MAQLGVDGVGKIDRGGALGQLNHGRVRSQHVDMVIKQATVLRLPDQILAPCQQLAQHGNLGVVVTAGSDTRVALGPSFLVGPVRRHAIFGMVMHGLGADLDFNGLAIVIAHHGVQRLVAVGLGLGNVVVEFRLDGRKCLVHKRQGCVAVLYRGHHHTQSANVEQLLEIQRLAAHLLDDAVDVFGPARHRGTDAVGTQRRFESLAQGHHVQLALHTGFVQQLCYLLIGIGLQKAEGQVFQLPFDLPDAQPVGQWRKHLQALARNGRRHRPFAGGVPAQGLQA
ncbi:hypothetical protein D3C72_887100 [compost metagenome]